MRHNRHHAAANARFRRQTHAPGKLSGVLIHATGRHQRIHLTRLHRGDNRRVEMNRLPLIGQEQKGMGQLNTVHLQRTVMEIVLQYRRDIVMEVTEGFHQPGNRRITRRMFKLRARHLRIVTNTGDAA